MNIPAVIEGVIPLAGGLAGTAVGFRRDLATTKPSVARRLRWLGPAVVAFGLWQLGSALTAEPPGVTAATIAAALRKKLAPPTMLDENTRADSVDIIGQHVLVRATIIHPPPTQTEREALLDGMFRHMRIGLCRNEPTRTWLQQGIGFEYEYTTSGKTYSPVIVTQKDCE